MKCWPRSGCRTCTAGLSSREPAGSGNKEIFGNCGSFGVVCHSERSGTSTSTSTAQRSVPQSAAPLLFLVGQTAEITGLQLINDVLGYSIYCSGPMKS